MRDGERVSEKKKIFILILSMVSQSFILNYICFSRMKNKF